MSTSPAAPSGLPASELFVCSGPQVGARHRLDQDEVLLGRSESCDVPLHDDRASSRHAQVVRDGANHRLMDLGSTNGTFVNNQRVHEVLLRPGDLVQIGETLFEYRQEAQRAAPESTSALAVPSYAPHGGYGYGYGYGPPPGYGLPPNSAPYGYIPGYAPQPQAQQEDEAPSINIPELLAKAKKILFAFLPFWWVFLLAIFLGGVGGYIYSRMKPPARTAMFEMTLIPTANDALTEEFSGGKIKFFREAESNFMSGRLIQETFSDLGHPDPDRELIEVFQRFLSFFKPGNMSSNLYVGQFQHRDPDFAVAFLETHVRNYLDSEMDKALRLVQVNKRFMEDKLDESQQRLQEAERELLDFKSQNLDALPEQARNVYESVYDLEQQLRQTKKQIEEERLELRYEKRKLRSVSAFTVQEQTRTNPYAAQISSLQAELASARASGKGPKHPDVVRLEKNLERVRELSKRSGGSQAESTRSSKNPLYAAAEANVFRLEQSLAVAEQEKTQLEQELQALKKRVARLPQRESKYADLVREYEAAKEEHLRLLDRVKQAQQQVELERASAEARYDLITPVQLKFMDESKYPLKMSVLGSAAGVFLGGFVVTVFLFWSRRLTLDLFIDPRKYGFRS